MKISDEELLRIIWHNQLLLATEAVLCEYVGERVGLVNIQANFWMRAAIRVPLSQIGKLNAPICDQQLLYRLHELARQQLIVIDRYRRSFYIDSHTAREAVRCAWEFYFRSGIPEGYDAENRCMRTATVPYLNALKSSCQRHVMQRFGDISLQSLKAA